MMMEESMSAERQAGQPAADAEERSAEPVALLPDNARFRCEGTRLQMARNGSDDWQEVEAVRLFPLTAPSRWISIVDDDLKEIGLIEDLAAFDRGARRCIEDELERRYLIPQIKRVISCRTRFDTAEWVVETNRGPATFLVRDPREKIKEPLPRHLTLTDAEGNRYDIPDVEALDATSRRLIAEWL